MSRLHFVGVLKDGDKLKEVVLTAYDPEAEELLENLAGNTVTIGEIEKSPNKYSPVPWRVKITVNPKTERTSEDINPHSSHHIQD